MFLGFHALSTKVFSALGSYALKTKKINIFGRFWARTVRMQPSFSLAPIERVLIRVVGSVMVS